MMRWFAVHGNVFTHPKFFRLGELLGSTIRARAVLLTLWALAAEHYDDGNVSALARSPTLIGDQLRWRGDKEKPWRALIGAGFLDLHADGTIIVHDWATHQRAYHSGRERVRRFRSAHTAMAAKDGCNVSETPCNGSTVQYSTVQDVPPISPSKTIAPEEPKSPRSQPVRVEDLPPAVREYWDAHPGRKGDAPRAVLRAWEARVKEGHQPADFVTAARAYREHCRAQGTKPQYVKGRAAFLGPLDQPWLNWLTSRTPERGEELRAQAVAVVNAWNEVARAEGWAQATAGNGVLARVEDALETSPDLPGSWRLGIDRLRGNPRLRGEERDGHRASLAWFLDRFVDVLGGRYDGPEAERVVGTKVVLPDVWHGQPPVVVREDQW